MWIFVRENWLIQISRDEIVAEPRAKQMRRKARKQVESHDEIEEVPKQRIMTNGCNVLRAYHTRINYASNSDIESISQLCCTGKPKPAVRWIDSRGGNIASVVYVYLFFFIVHIAKSDATDFRLDDLLGFMALAQAREVSSSSDQLLNTGLA